MGTTTVSGEEEAAWRLGHERLSLVEVEGWAGVWRVRVAVVSGKMGGA